MKELILVPTPLQDDLPLEPIAKEKLLEDCLKDSVTILVEEHKVARQRWLKWGLPREAIEKFILFNEHTQEKLQNEIIKSGHKVYLLSDCGMPAFCDPGQKLVDLCHKKKIKLTSTPFPNSIVLALSLSGFSHERFVFSGFIPQKEPQREAWIKNELKCLDTLIWMETPYRLKKILDELSEYKINRQIFLAMDLGSPQESLLRGKPADLIKSLGVNLKREFVLVIRSE